MRKKIIAMIIVFSMVATAITACGDSQSSSTSDEITQLEEKITSNSDEVTLDDYNNLANLYEENGWVLKERNLLESAYLTYGDNDCLLRLNKFFVNLEEESSDVADMCDMAFDELGDASTYGALADLMRSTEWFYTVMPVLADGYRNYYKANDNGSISAIQVGYQNGVRTATAYLLGGDSSFTGVQIYGSTAQILQTSYYNQDDTVMYSGSFSLTTLRLADGKVSCDTGSFSEDKVTGDFQSVVGAISSDDLVTASFDSIWSARGDLSYETYTGSFQDGTPTIEQPADLTLPTDTGYTTLIVYAKNADSTSYLWQGFAEGQEPIWTSATLNIIPKATVVEYTPEIQNDADSSANESSGSSASIKIRIFSGMVQYYDGSTWITVDSVANLEAADSASAENAYNANATDIADNHSIAKIVKEESAESSSTSSSKSSSSSKSNSSSKSSSSSKTTAQSQQATQSQSATQQTTPSYSYTPSTPSGDSSSSSSYSAPNSDSSSTSGGSSSSASGDSSSSASGDSSSSASGDSSSEPEIEWSDDMM